MIKITQEYILDNLRNNTGSYLETMPYDKKIEREFWILYKETLIREIKKGERNTIMQQDIKTEEKRVIDIILNNEQKGIEIYADNTLTSTELEYIHSIGFKWSKKHYIFWRKYDNTILEKLKIYFNKEDIELHIRDMGGITYKTKRDLEQALLKLIKENSGDISREAIIKLLRGSNPDLI